MTPAPGALRGRQASGSASTDGRRRLYLTPDGTLAESAATVEDARVRPRRSDGLATRQKILRVATTMFAAGGYEATSLRQIAVAAEVDLATLKYHFGDKPALYSEVYRVGHEAFIGMVGPVLQALLAVEDEEGLVVQIGRLVDEAHTFAEHHMPFIQTVMYRLLEDSTDTIRLEEDLQGVARGMIETVFDALAARGVTRRVDARAFGTFLLTSLGFWFVTGQKKPHWFGAPGLDTAAGRARSEAFLRRQILAALLLDPARTG